MEYTVCFVEDFVVNVVILTKRPSNQISLWSSIATCINTETRTNLQRHPCRPNVCFIWVLLCDWCFFLLKDGWSHCLHKAFSDYSLCTDITMVVSHGLNLDLSWFLALLSPPIMITQELGPNNNQMFSKLWDSFQQGILLPYDNYTVGYNLRKRIVNTTILWQNPYLATFCEVKLLIMCQLLVEFSVPWKTGQHRTCCKTKVGSLTAND